MANTSPGNSRRKTLAFGIAPIVLGLKVNSQGEEPAKILLFLFFSAFIFMGWLGGFRLQAG